MYVNSLPIHSRQGDPSMRKRFISIVLFVSFTIMCSAVPSSYADAIFTQPAGSSPNIFYYGWRGVFIGSLAGLSAGYLRYADENNTSEMLRSLAYGALAGAGVGLIAGFADASNGNVYGAGDTILRDMNSGGGFGLAVGLLWGGISAISKGDSREVGKGAAWGYLGGLVVGLGVAIVQNASGTRSSTACAVPSQTIVPSIAFYRDSRQQPYPAVRCSYHFGRSTWRIFCAG